MKFIKALFLLSFLFSAVNGLAQTDTAFLTHAINSLDKYTADNPIEKVYLHTDRDTYLPGDTVWFKAYTVIGQKHELSTLSGVLYVKLVGAKDSVLQSITLNIAAGITWGDLALPSGLKPGGYHIIAFTNWMRNAGGAYFFDKAIAVNNIQAAKLSKTQAATGRPDVQFLPEGGALINGLRGKVAVKSVNGQGLGEDLTGSIIDNEGNEVAYFKTQHLGMGIFAITPQAGKTYRVKLTQTTGNQFTAELPKAQDDGFSIAINNSQPDSLGLRVMASARLFESRKNAGYYLLAQSGGKVYYTAGFKLSAQSFNAVIDKKRFPAGITYFTLFTDNGEPLNERLAFIRHIDTLKVTLNTTGKTFTTRQKVKIGLAAADNSNGKSVTGSFSVAVVNEGFAPDKGAAENTIVSNLLLTSDIKGHIEQPNYYFTNVTYKTEADLDILMLTQGYHRFEWKKVLSDNNATPVFEPEKSLQVSGYVKTLSGKPISNSKVSLLTTTGGLFMLDTLTDENGRFTFGLIPDESLKYIIQARTGKNNKNVMVVPDTAADIKVDKIAQPILAADNIKQLTTYQKQIAQQLKISLDKRIIQLKEVVIKEKKEQPKNIFTHPEDPDQVINDFPKEGTGETLSQFLAVRVRGISFSNNKAYSNRVIARTPAGMAPKPVQVVLDGAYVDYDVYMSLNLTDIENAEIIRTSGKGGIYTQERAGAGMLFLTSRKLRGGVKPSTPDVITYQSNGFYKAREFYSPVYDKINENYTKPDLRTTIYWKPNIVTDGGAASFEFFNADTRGTYRVTVEGIDADGNLGRAVYRYNVE